ncbi:MAM domain-containing glycosylphosphatidylinositol anchor protein 2-like [Stylophora pistillata]|uniref:MAM domain-containing glycosylphosphatidylinositol anchor protein 2-like n=1 Tax=Stylophora pistillata TaxID=50429 RepID=UPI000C04C04C|nr:MAM domain-containing glycosylphosphatidylinositol anchor protein 2-like [Stylophora pistillata]
MEWFSMIWFSFLLVNVQLLVRKADGTQITWFEPLPVETARSASDMFAPNVSRHYDGQAATLLWNLSLSQDLSLLSVDIYFNSDIIVKLLPNGGSGEIAAAFRDRFRVNWNPPGRVALVISKVTSADDKVNGTFSCVVSTLSNGNWRRRIQVEVVAPVTTPEIGGERTVREGGSLQLTCEASGKPDPNITWTRGNPGNQGNIGVKQAGKVLTIPIVSRNDSGTFTCTAHNGIGEPKSQAVYVNVTYPAKIVKFQDEYIVELQQSVTLSCEAEGNPPPTYTWFPCGFKQVCDKNTLNISRVLADANYTCRVANALGSDSKSADVYIGGNIVNITMVITSEVYEDEKYNQSLFLEKLTELLKEAFASKPGYEGVQFLDVRPGTITVDLALKFKFPTKEKDVITTLNAALKDGKLGEFSVSSIKGTRHDVATTSPTTTPTDGSSVGKSYNTSSKTFPS